jgi:Rieske 2Fe-2S family protein
MDARRAPASRLHGLFGLPYLDLGTLIDTSGFEALDDEISLGLARVATSPTGGSLKWMGVVAPWAMADGYVDYGHVVEALSEDDWRRFISLADDPAAFDVAERASYTFGDETDHPLTEAQARWLRFRHRVYFPWKHSYHLLENDRWEDKHSGRGKTFSPEAEALFPRTVAFVKGLPFSEIGRVVIFGVAEHDHAPAHRDTEPGAESIAQSISFDPRGDKRFYVCGDDGAPKHVVDARVYWFNDMDWHGVEPDPFFRYSVRVDGVFTRDFGRAVQRLARG